MKNRISAILAAALLAGIAACGTAPTAPATAAGDWQADASAPPGDSTGSRTPNMFGSGN